MPANVSRRTLLLHFFLAALHKHEAKRQQSGTKTCINATMVILRLRHCGALAWQTDANTGYPGNTRHSTDFFVTPFAYAITA